MNKTNYTTNTNSLNPNFITGFCDAEGSFTLNISKDPRYALGWSIKLVFNIHLNSKDIESLYLIQRFFCAGNVTMHGDTAMFQVIKLSDLACIIEHFNNYPLLTQKHADYLLFKKAFNIVSNKQHQTEIGLHKLISIRASMNKGLPRYNSWIKTRST